jgi:hypothetical protein
MGEETRAVWQCNSYKPIVSGESDLARIRAYILTNPNGGNKANGAV